MHGRPIRTSLGSEPYKSALVCTRPKNSPSQPQNLLGTAFCNQFRMLLAILQDYFVKNNY